MNNRDAELIRRMQDNLAVIRKVGGWTTAQFGEEIGVTRQTVSNLEKGRTPLTKAQYLAIRAVLIHEIGANGNEGLAKVVSALVDDPLEETDESSTDEREPSPTANAMEDMTMLTKALASESVLALLGAASVTLPSVTMRTLPSVLYAFTKHTKGK